MKAAPFSLRPRAPALLVLALALAAAAPARAQTLSATERKIAAYVDAHSAEAVSLLEHIVNINSGTLNPAGVREVGQVLAGELRPLGFDIRWTEPADATRAGHLFAEHTGGRGKRLLLIGHLDTVFEKDDPFQRFVRTGNTATGPGVNDMKGGDVVIVYALKALHAAGALKNANVIAAFTGDEESPGSPLDAARRELIEAAKRSDVALEFETASRDAGQEFATIARRSSTGWTLRVTARPGHSSGIFREGAGSGAIFEAARILNTFHEELRGEEFLTFNPGLILGGTEVRFDKQEARGTAFGKTNVIAQSAMVSGDIRTISEEQLQRTRERMRAIVARHLPDAEAEITFSEGYPAMSPTAGNRALLDRLNQVNRAAGFAAMQPYDPGRRGAADISFVAPYVDGLAGLGVHGSGAHSNREQIDLATLPMQIKRAALLIYRLSQEPRP